MPYSLLDYYNYLMSTKCMNLKNPIHTISTHTLPVKRNVLYTILQYELAIFTNQYSYPKGRYHINQFIFVAFVSCNDDNDEKCII